MLTFGLSVIKSLAKNQTIEEFVLYIKDIEDSNKRDRVLHDMLGRLPPDQRTKFTTGEYTEHGRPCLCIRLSASGDY